MTNKFWRNMNILSQGIEYTPVCDALFSNINRYIDYQHTFILSQYSFLFLRRYVNNIPSIFYEAVSELVQELVLETKICGFDSHQPHQVFQQLSRQNNCLLSDRSSVQIRPGTPLIGHQLNQQSGRFICGRYKEHSLDDRPIYAISSTRRTTVLQTVGHRGSTCIAYQFIRVQRSLAKRVRSGPGKSGVQISPLGPDDQFGEFPQINPYTKIIH